MPSTPTPPMHFLLLSVALMGCSQNGGVQLPEVVFDSPAGIAPIYTPPGSPYAALAAPPGSLDPVPQGSRNGTYTGTATPLDTGMGECISNHNVSGFHVAGNRVRFGGFHGTIAPDGGLQMAYGQQWIVGQFDGPTFSGQYDLSGRINAIGCTYMLTLRRTGP